MNFFKKFNFSNNTLVFIVVSLLSVVVFFYKDSKYTIRVKGIVLELFEVLSRPNSWYKNILAVKEENQLFANQIAQLSLLNSKLINYEIENKELRKLLDYKESFSLLSLLPANIVNSNYSISVKSCLINVGLDHSLKKNLTVIDKNGYLIGKTINIGKNNSNVQLITDNNFSVSVKIGQNSVLGQFKPTFGKYGILEGVIKSLDIKKGDIIYTSGISEIYPSDIPLAKVISNETKQNKLFQDVAVEILADVNNLYYVFIIQ